MKGTLIFLLSFMLVFPGSLVAQEKLPPEFEVEILKDMWTVDDASQLSIYNLPKVLKIVRGLFTQPSKVKIISEVFEDLLILDPESMELYLEGEIEAPLPFKVLSRAEQKRREAGEVIPGITSSELREMKILSEGRFIKLLRRADQLMEENKEFGNLLQDLENFLDAYPRDSEELLRAKADYLNWRRKYVDLKYSIKKMKTHDQKVLEHQIRQATKLVGRKPTKTNKDLLARKKRMLKRLKDSLPKKKAELAELGKKRDLLENKISKIWKELRAIDDPIFKEEFAGRLRSILDKKDYHDKFILDNEYAKPVGLFMSPEDRKKGLYGYEVTGFVASQQLIFEPGEELPMPGLDLEKITYDDFITGEKREGLLLRPGNLLQAWIDFIDEAKHTLALNVFEWDIPEIKEALIRAHKRGVKVRASFDMDAMHHYPERMKIYYELRKYVDSAGAAQDGTFSLSLIDSVSLNHQKMAVRDHEWKALAATLFSSGNLSTSGALGDLYYSVLKDAGALPNANHLYTMKSYVLANVVEHNLLKTQVLRLRGTSGPNAYPKAGSFLVKSKKGSYTILAFTPNGGEGNIHDFHTAKSIHHTHGDLALMQMTASSNDVLEALKTRAKREMAINPNWQLYGIGDYAPFLADYSLFLKMTGYERLSSKESKKQKARFVPIPDSEWRTIFGDQYERIMSGLRSAPAQYQMYYLRDENGNTVKDELTGNAILLSVKYHHKAILAGVAYTERDTGYEVYAVPNGSAQVTEGSLTNQEHFLVTVDYTLSKFYQALFRGTMVDTTKDQYILNMIEEANKEVRDKLEGNKKGSTSKAKELRCKSSAAKKAS